VAFHIIERFQSHIRTIGAAKNMSCALLRSIDYL